MFIRSKVKIIKCQLLKSKFAAYFDLRIGVSHLVPRSNFFLSFSTQKDERSFLETF